MKATSRFDIPSEPAYRTSLDVHSLSTSALHRLRLKLSEDGATQPVCLPVIVARGASPGPVVGITAALHGNEVNGIPTIHRLFRTFEPSELTGSIVAVPIVNVQGYNRFQREFHDGKDLNRAFPGDAEGAASEVFAHRFLNEVVRGFDYLIDLHTASFGRTNTLYVRADMTREISARLSRVLGPQIIVHNAGADGTLRGAAQALGIHAITIEIGNPQRQQNRLITASRIGLRDILEHLGMLAPDHESPPFKPVECQRSFWLYTDGGGFLEVFPELAAPVEKGEPIAQLSNEWGDVLRAYEAPEDGVVIGKSTNPVAHSGARILHLGIVGRVPVSG